MLQAQFNALLQKSLRRQTTQEEEALLLEWSKKWDEVSDDCAAFLKMQPDQGKAWEKAANKAKEKTWERWQKLKQEMYN